MRYALTAVAMAVLLLGSSPAAVNPAAVVMAASDVQGGLVVHLGCGDPSTGSGQAGAFTAALRTNESFLVQGLGADADNVTAAKKHIRAGGLYGP
jgi:hypothetical protein